VRSASCGAWWPQSHQDFGHFSGLGWARTRLSSSSLHCPHRRERWVPWVREADVLWSTAGDATYLATGCAESGLGRSAPYCRHGLGE